MRNRSRLVLAAFLASVVISTIGCDQTTKHLARTHLDGAAPISLLGGTLRIVLAQNSGAFLSLGASLPPHLRVMAFVIGVGGVLLGGAGYLLFAFGPATRRSFDGTTAATAEGSALASIEAVDRAASECPTTPLPQEPAQDELHEVPASTPAPARAAFVPFSALAFAWLAWAGGFSNLVDRVLFEGRVTDFVILGVGPLRTGVFNVADVAIVAGGICFVLLAGRANDA